ncbi:MAG: response regulator [Candidatus Dadabacteria bacterium]
MDTLEHIRLVIAEDAVVFREGLKSAIKNYATDRLSIVGEAENGKQLLNIVDNINPDVVITDIRMPEMDGYQLTRQLRKNYPTIPVLALSNLNDGSSIYHMLEAGAKGYISKTAPFDDMIEAIQTVYSGRIYYCNSSSSSLLQLIGKRKNKLFNGDNEVSLTVQEITFIKLLCSELSIKEIAVEMHLSVRAADDYCRRIKEKTKTISMVGIALYAVKNGIL